MAGFIDGCDEGAIIYGRASTLQEYKPDITEKEFVLRWMEASFSSMNADYLSKDVINIASAAAAAALEFYRETWGE